MPNRPLNKSKINNSNNAGNWSLHLLYNLETYQSYKLYYKLMHSGNASLKHGRVSVNKAIFKCFVIGLSYMQWSENVSYHITNMPAFEHLLRLQHNRHELIKIAWTLRQAMWSLKEGHWNIASCAPSNGIMHTNTRHASRWGIELKQSSNLVS